ncbi:f7cc0302-5bbe-4dff-b4d8-260c837b8b63 [Thermothielavioides terrestris]|uniref:F7cc0302-5bbe-4dff-b4d8-260c837b8b63 n=1 Tax=Thermothielavioides terrestris TaxID=2587410 RepID=A0A446BY64_9PEZI|nr:f7cc0302-5bbe-4dff-b4d8-260c837b8b63 [Thermothielavioides terrestris]
MSNQSKFITIGLVLAFGIGNAFYAFDPSFKELKEQREGTKSKQ